MMWHQQTDTRSTSHNTVFQIFALRYERRITVAAPYEWLSPHCDTSGVRDWKIIRIPTENNLSVEKVELWEAVKELGI